MSKKKYLMLIHTYDYGKYLHDKKYVCRILKHMPHVSSAILHTSKCAIINIAFSLPLSGIV